jgi:hypothetical protein
MLPYLGSHIVIVMDGKDQEVVCNILEGKGGYRLPHLKRYFLAN